MHGDRDMNRIQKTIIKQAIEDPSHLSDWEYDFVNDLADKEDDYELSEKQNSILNRIGSKL